MKRAAIIAALLVPVLVVAGGAFFAAARSDDNDTADIVAYPDLQAREPLRLRLTTKRTDEKVLLRFESIFWNSGEGPLEVRPDNREDDASTNAFQRLYTWSDGGELVLVREATVGSFAFHPEHKHWHLGDFADYELHPVADDGSIGDGIAAASDKISFCLLDDEEINLAMEHSPPEAHYGRCKQDTIQGISVGWGDSYESFLPGQSIDISRVPDGEYWLVLVVDPDNLLEESNEDNNTSAVKLKLAGDEIEVFYTEETPTPGGGDDEEGE